MSWSTYTVEYIGNAFSVGIFRCVSVTECVPIGILQCSLGLIASGASNIQEHRDKRHRPLSTFLGSLRHETRMFASCQGSAVVPRGGSQMGF